MTFSCNRPIDWLGADLGENELKYSQVKTHLFPKTLDTRPTDEKLLDELRYRLNILAYDEARLRLDRDTTTTEEEEREDESSTVRFDLDHVMGYSRIQRLARDIDHAR